MSLASLSKTLVNLLTALCCSQAFAMRRCFRLCLFLFVSSTTNLLRKRGGAYHVSLYGVEVIPRAAKMCRLLIYMSLRDEKMDPLVTSRSLATSALEMTTTRWLPSQME